MFTVANGDAEGHGRNIHALELRPVPAIQRSSGARAGVVLRGAWWQEEVRDTFDTAGFMRRCFRIRCVAGSRCLRVLS